MAGASALFMLLWVPRLLPFAVAGTAVAYACAYGVHHGQHSPVRQRALLLLSFGLEAGLFVYYARQYAAGPLERVMLATVLLSAFSHPADLYRQDSHSLCPPVDFLAYSLFFGKLIYGPLVGADEFVFQLGRRRTSATRMGSGVFSLFVGLSQMLLFAHGLDLVGGYLTGLSADERSLLLLGLEVLTLALTWYFRLAGCANMAQGAGLLFGIDLPRNLAYPFGAGSFAGFFNRFLITQNAYTRSYLAPLLGGDGQVGGGSPLAVMASAAFAGAFLGLPDGAVWGSVFGLLIWIERLLGLRGSGGPLRKLAVWAGGVVSFALLLPDRGRYLAEGLWAIGQMPLVSERAVGLLVVFGPLLILSMVLSSRMVQSAAGYLKGRLPALYNAAVLMWGIGAMALCLSALIWNGR